MAKAGKPSVMAQMDQRVGKVIQRLDPAMAESVRRGVAAGKAFVQLSPAQQQAITQAERDQAAGKPLPDRFGINTITARATAKRPRGKK